MSYIAVHAGAGNYRQKDEDIVKKALRRACFAGLDQARIANEKKHLNTVQRVIEVLEDDPHLNAGTGSNLTIEGTVECDAAIMDGSCADFGSLGAVSGIPCLFSQQRLQMFVIGVKNPIRLARHILNYSTIPDPLGRIPPIMLVSEGARAFAKTCYGEGSNQLVPAESLVTAHAIRDWKKWTDKLKDLSQSNSDSRSISPHLLGDEQGLTDVQDTVGAVVSEGWEETAAGVSSGGLLLKHPGRIGEAALFGAGCWAKIIRRAKMGIACSVSGAGEYITRSRLARAVGDAFLAQIDESEELDPHSILLGVLKREFLAETRGYRASNLDAGILLLVTEEVEDKIQARVWCAFTTPTMAIAYASAANPKPKALILRQPTGPKVDSRERRIFITAITL